MMQRLFQIGGLLMLGLLLNVAIAWGWAAWGLAPHRTIGNWSISHDDAPFWAMREFAGAGAAITHVRPWMNESAEINPYLVLSRNRPDVNARVLELFPNRPSDDDRRVRFGFDERGWPMRALRSKHTYSTARDGDAIVTGVTVTGGIQLWPELTARGGWGLQRVRALPLIPIWPGFITNTLLYALLAAAVLVGYPAMVRLLGRRRCLQLGIVAVIIAPLLVFGIAWTAAINHAPRETADITGAEPRTIDDDGMAFLNVDRHDQPGASRVIISAALRVGRELDGLPRPPLEGVSPRWVQQEIEHARNHPIGRFAWHTHEATGWPARAMRSSFNSSIDGQTLVVIITDIRGVLFDEPPTGMDVGAAKDIRILPTRPLWSGFLLNWLLYSFALFGLIGAPIALRRGFRIRRGRCLRCGYDLRGKLSDGCPECGWQRERDAGNAQHENRQL